jgi:hypothetical protein
MADVRIDNIATEIYAQLKDRLGQAWADRFTAADQQVVRLCCIDAAELQVRALATPRDRAAHLELLREKAQINAQLANIAACEASHLVDAFWEAVGIVVNSAAAVAFAVL